jgi:flagellar basal body rod protein FlgG
MSGTLYQIGSELMNHGVRQELIAANLAGGNLAGFKGRQLFTAPFALEADDAGQSGGAESPNGDTGNVITDFGQGSLRNTMRSLDFAISGEGFFQVSTTGDQRLLTRNGNFRVDNNNLLVTKEGHRVAGVNGFIRFGDSDSLEHVRVSGDGEVSVMDEDNESRSVGRLRVVDVANPTTLARMSANYFGSPAEEDLRDASDFELTNGFLENSNISPIREMAAMIESVREFEMGQKMMQMMAEIARQEEQKLQA